MDLAAVYAPLPSCSFRLLTILPSSPSDPSLISCQLSTHPLSSAPPYTALSYTWGSHRNPLPVQLGNNCFPVRQNLHQALTHIRINAKGNPVTLWADAICINQDDPDERTDQVRQMHTIYTNASDVLVWLGPSSPDSSAALDFVLELPDLLTEAKRAGSAKSQKVLNDPSLQDRWHALGRLLTRPWWRRVWIIQEISLARSARLLVGTHSIPWSSMYALLSELKHSWQWALHTKTEPDVATIIRLASTSRSIFDIAPSLAAHGHTADLGALLKITHLFKSTDPRDKIYALLGLTDAHTQHHIQPDYRKSTSDNANFSLSWTVNNPDPWLDDIGVDGGHEIAKSRKIYAAGDPALAGVQPVAPKFAGSVMNLPGVQFDTIVELDMYKLFDLLEYSHNRITETQVVEKLKTEADTGEGADLPYIAGGSSRMAFYRTLLLDCDIPYINPGTGSPQRLPKPTLDVKSSKDTPSPIPIPPKSASEVDVLLHKIQGSLAFFYGRCFAMTSTGYMGVVPRTAKPGDWVCVLLGGELPFVIRKVGDGFFRLVGECYLQGIMDGEVME
ncbi:HET-domain-containing protein, partial [Leucogyrophana mollusca]